MFFVLSLPRSRSKWTSAFLSYSGLSVGHDLTVGCGTIAEFDERLEGLAGTVETGAVVGWRLLRSRWPQAKFAAIRRPVEQIAQSFASHGWTVNQQELWVRHEMLEAFASSPEVLSVDFTDLATPSGASRLFEHCLGLGFDFEWWRTLNEQNIQIDLSERIATLAAAAHQSLALQAEVLAATAQLGEPSRWAMWN